jgi:hypothetical protein
MTLVKLETTCSLGEQAAREMRQKHVETDAKTNLQFNLPTSARNSKPDPWGEGRRSKRDTAIIFLFSGLHVFATI